MSGKTIAEIFKNIKRNTEKLPPWEGFNQSKEQHADMKQRAQAVSLGIPFDEMIQLTFAAFEQKHLTEHCLKTYQMFLDWTPEESFGVILAGPPGVGKTHLVRALTIKWHSSTYQTRFINWGEFIDDLRGNYETKNQKVDHILSGQLLAIDELGVGTRTEFSDDILYRIVNTALRSKIAIFGTTNFSTKDFDKQFDGRVVDRLRSCSPIVSFTNGGRSFRERQHETHRRRIQAMRGET